MARVVVIGGGYAGMASAARLAKLGHQVSLVEESASLGGALAVEDGAQVEGGAGFSWDGGPTSMLLPAVARDLFRKTGRPLERELELEPLETIREHWFADGSTLELTGGSRAAQAAAFDELGPGLGQQWVDHVDAYGEDWEVLRQGYFEAPWDRDALPPEVAARFTSRETMTRRLKRVFTDERLRLVAGHPFVADGHDLRDVPAWAGLSAYLEQRFGAWRVLGGTRVLAQQLGQRLATRGVEVRTGTRAVDLVLHAGRVAGVRTDAGTLDAEVVVCAIDPRGLPALATYVARTMPVIPPVVTHLGLIGDLPELPHEVVLHGDPMLVLRTGTGTAPEGGAAWTVHGRGRLAEDVLRALARGGIDVREQVVARLDLTPRQLVERWNGSPAGVLWQGRQTVRRRLGPDTPVPGVYAAGAHATPGSGLPFVGLSAALVAQAVGPA